jgi:hypothetical protein
MQAAGKVGSRRQMARSAISLRERNRRQLLQHFCLDLFIGDQPDFFNEISSSRFALVSGG